MAHVCLLQVRVEKDKVIIRANKQVMRKRMWRIHAGQQNNPLIDLCSSKTIQALQAQKRSKPMARCAAVINSSTGFSHVVIVGSGQCVKFFTSQITKIYPHSIDRLHSVVFLIKRLCRSSRSGVCRDTEARGLH